jgi:hypothetical protein
MSKRKNKKDRFNLKKVGQQRHAKLRAEQRFGLSLSRDNVKDIVHMIQKGYATFVRRASTIKTLWAVGFRGRKFYVAYDKNTKMITTVMPLIYAVCDILKDVSNDVARINRTEQFNPEKDLPLLEEKVDLACKLFEEIK